MAGRVVPVATPLRLDLSSDLAGGAEEIIVIARVVDLAPATEATLRIAIASIDLQTSGVVGFVLEACPVYLAENAADDIVGDPVASIAIKEVSAGTLLLDAFDSGFAGPVQVRMRCGQPTSGRMLLRAYIDVVLKWFALGSDVAALVDSSRERVARELQATRRRLAEMRSSRDADDWTNVAASQAFAALLDIRHTGRGCCVLPGSIIVNEVAAVSSTLGREQGLTSGRGRERHTECAQGVCCERIVLELPDDSGTVQSVDAEVCYPSQIDPRGLHALVVITHGSADGSAPSDFDWFDPPFAGGAFRSMQHDLAKHGIIAAFIAKLDGYTDRASYLIHAVPALKVWILSRATEEPESPLANVDTGSLRVGFLGHSDGGHAATLAASEEYGIPVLACVNLASPPPDEAGGATLHPGTYYMQMIGTHDGSPSVTVTHGVQAIEFVSTDRPRVLVLLVGVNHGQLGPGIGSGAAINTPQAYTAATTLDGDQAMVLRNFYVRIFLRWALLGISSDAQKMFVDGATMMVFSENHQGEVVAGLAGPRTTPCLMRTRTESAPLVSVFTAIDLFDGGQAFEPISDNITSAVSQATNVNAEASGFSVKDCAGGSILAQPPRSEHLGQAAFVSWDFFTGGVDSDAIIRIPLDFDFSTLLSGFQTTDQFSLVCEVALRTNSALNLVDHNWWDLLWPALGLGDASGPQAWIRPQPILNAWRLECPLLFTTGVGVTVDVSQTTLTSIAARLSLLVSGELSSVTHAFVDSYFPGYPRGESVIRALRLLFHG